MAAGSGTSSRSTDGLTRPIALALLGGLRRLSPTSTHSCGRVCRPPASTAPVAFVQDPADRSVQFVVQQDGRIRVVRGGAVLRAGFPRPLVGSSSPAASRGCSASRSRPTRRPAAASSSTSPTDPATPWSRASADRATPLVADPASRFDLRWGGAGGPAFIAQPFANHNGGNLVFGPDGFLYIGLGDGGSGDDPDHRAQNPRELLGKMLRIDVNVPDTHPTGYQVPPDNPFVARRAGRGAARDLGVRPAQSVALQLRRSGARRHRRAGHRRRRPEPVGRDRLRAGEPRRPQLRLAQSRRRARQRHVASAGVPAAGRSDSRVRPHRRRSRSPAATCIAARALPATLHAAATSSRTSSRAASGRSR